MQRCLILVLSAALRPSLVCASLNSLQCVPGGEVPSQPDTAPAAVPTQVRHTHTLLTAAWTTVTSDLVYVLHMYVHIFPPYTYVITYVHI